MAKNEPKRLPQFSSLDELVRSFDSQDWGDYLEHLPKVDFEVDLKRKVYAIVLETALADQVEELARSQQTSPESLVNAWVREKLLEQR